VEVTASAPGKLIVLGEYAVLEGAESLVWAVDRRARVVARTTEEAGLVVVAPEIGVERAEADIDGFGTVRWRPGLDGDTRFRLRMVGAAVAGSAHELAGEQRELPSVHLRIDSSAFLAAGVGEKLGVGSSAAVMTALTGALLALGGIDVGSVAGRRRVFERVLTTHHQAQGDVGSGVDVAASTFGGVLRYRRGPSPAETATPARIEPFDGLHWAAVWSGRAAYTTSMVTMVRTFAHQNPAAFDELIDDLGDTSTRGCDAFAAGDVGAFLDAVGEYDDGLARLGAAAGVDIVSRDHQRIGSVVRAEGGVYKPSGAGGGDLGIAFSPQETVHDAIVAALARGGCATVDLAVDEHGLRLEP
jgi:phosphomevalonate kinase